MAKTSGITIDVSIGIPQGVARLCLQSLEIYLNQNPEIDIQGKRMPDGSIMLEFVMRDDPRWEGICGKAYGEIRQQENGH